MLRACGVVPLLATPYSLLATHYSLTCMLVPRLIERKRDGLALTPDEWRALVNGYVAGQVPDYQMSALAMAVVWRGLEPGELAALTDAMPGPGGWPNSRAGARRGWD